MTTPHTRQTQGRARAVHVVREVLDQISTQGTTERDTRANPAGQTNGHLRLAIAGVIKKVPRVARGAGSLSLVSALVQKVT